MTPWSHLQGFEHSAGHRGLFLDYISPTFPEILWQSLRNKDFTVTASGLVVNLITLLMVISTGLLTLQQRPIRQEHILYRPTTRFAMELSDIWISVGSAESSLPMNLLDAIDTINLPYPVGTTPEMNYQMFEPASEQLQDVQEATVDVVVIDVGCQAAELQVLNWTWSWTPCVDPNILDAPLQNRYASVSVDNCSISPSIQYPYTHDGAIGHFAFMDVFYCEFGVNESSIRDRLYFGVGQAQQHGSAGPKPSVTVCNQTAPSATVEVLQSRQWICLPEVAIVKGNVTFNASTITSGGLPNISIDPSRKRYIPGSPQMNLLGSQSFSDLQTQSILESSQIPQAVQALSYLEDADVYLYDTLVRVLRKNAMSSMQDLLNTDLFLESTQTFWKRLQLQLIHSGMVVASKNGTVEGSSIVQQSRLLAQKDPVRLMQGFLATIIALATYILICFTGSAPHDPSTLSGMILSLRHQAETLSLFKGTGCLDTGALRNCIMTKVVDASAPPDSLTDKATGVRWWRPIPVKTSARLIAFVSTILVLIALQVLLSLSNRNQGVTNVSVEGNQHLAWSAVPALIVVSLAVFYKALGSSYKTFAQFHQLRCGASSKSLLTEYTTLTEAEVLIHALQDRQLSIVCMSLSVIISAFLTITVSGVWTPSPVPSMQAVQLNQTSWFNNGPSTDDGSAGNNAFVSGAILSVNASFPKWTFEDLALASFSYDADAGEQSLVIEADVPAIRASLSCTLYDQSQVPNLSYYDIGAGYGSHGNPQPRGFGFLMPGPESCKGDDLQTIYFDPNQQAYIGPGWGAFVANTRKDCPLLNFFWGRQETNSGGEPIEGRDYVTYFKALSCYEAIDQVQVSANFSMALDLDATARPLVLDGSMQPFSNTNITLPYGKLPNLGNNETTNHGIWALIQYRHGIELADLGNVDKVDTIVDSIKSTHGTIRAQQYNAALRMDESIKQDGKDPKTINARLLSPERHRLVQNPISTHVLCALLASMVILSMLSSWLMSTNYVLPKNPCSIAATISLLADSNIFNDEVVLNALKRAVIHSKREAKQLNGRKFLMGWFESGADGRRLFTVNVLDSPAGLEEHEK